MSSHSKTIGRIQSAPPDEGEPDLKIQFNLNALEFNPLQFKSTQKKELSAAASDYVPETKLAPNIGFNSYIPTKPAPKYVSPYISSYSIPLASAPMKSFAFNPGVSEFAPTEFVPNIGKTSEFVPKIEKSLEFVPNIKKSSEFVVEGIKSVEEVGKGEQMGKKNEGNLNGQEGFKRDRDKENSNEDEGKKEGKLEETVIQMSNSELGVDTVKDIVETVVGSEECVSRGADKEELLLIEEIKTQDLSPDVTTQDLVYKKKVYDIEAIKNFKSTFVKDPNFLILPMTIISIKDREVEELKTSKGNRKNQDDRRPKEIIRKVVVWRKAKTAEEQKISDKAKAYQRKFTATVAEQEKIKKEIKSTLNKLSPNNLSKLTASILETCKKSHDCLKLVVSGIFEKAWSEKKYTQMYSDMCKTLKNSFEAFRYPDTDTTKLPDTRNYFKYELLYMCEETFVKNHSAEDLSHLTAEQRTERFSKLKDKTLGNVRFIGELFNVNLITAKIVLECVIGLLDLFEQEQNEDRLEGACLLLLTGGPSFERSKLLEETNRIYERLERINGMGISSKNKFKILDLKEFRQAGWSAQREGLKKIEEIHADHILEQEEIKRRHGY